MRTFEYIKGIAIVGPHVKYLPSHRGPKGVRGIWARTTHIARILNEVAL